MHISYLINDFFNNHFSHGAVAQISIHEEKISVDLIGERNKARHRFWRTIH